MSQLARPEIWGGLLYLGVISTACAFMLWNRGLQLLNAASGGLFFFFQPLSGTLLGWLLLGETIGGTFWIGAAAYCFRRRSRHERKIENEKKPFSK